MDMNYHLKENIEMFEGLLDYLKAHLPQKIVDGGYNSYEIFGKEAETPISDTIEEYLKISGVKYIPRRSSNKNEFPDLELTIDGTKYALEHKSGACCIKGKNEASSANDMGTINAYPDKIKKYGDNIYCTFVKYSVSNNNIITIEDVYFDKIYTFIGKGTGFANQLQYREKDGNLRPKTWFDMENNITYFSDFNAFKDALKETDRYRSERIAIKHIDKLDETSLRKIKSHIDQKLKK